MRGHDLDAPSVLARLLRGLLIAPPYFHSHPSLLLHALGRRRAVELPSQPRRLQAGLVRQGGRRFGLEQFPLHHRRQSLFQHRQRPDQGSMPRLCARPHGTLLRAGLSRSSTAEAACHSFVCLTLGGTQKNTRLQTYNFGLTDLCKLTSGNDDQLPPGSLKADRLLTAIASFKPRFLPSRAGQHGASFVGTPQCMVVSNRITERRFSFFRQLRRDGAKGAGANKKHYWHHFADAVRSDY
jgi:hypothetical protein